MATAKPFHPLPPQQPVVVLELTAKEARALRTVCGRVGGDPCGLRGGIDAIRSALDDVSGDIALEWSSDDANGSVSFRASSKGLP